MTIFGKIISNIANILNHFYFIFYFLFFNKFFLICFYINHVIADKDIFYFKSY